MQRSSKSFFFTTTPTIEKASKYVQLPFLPQKENSGRSTESQSLQLCSLDIITQ